MTDEEIRWLLENLPLDLVRHIIAAYNPQCLFIMHIDWLMEYDWEKQCRAIFNVSGDIYNYYLLCQRHCYNQICFGNADCTIVLRDKELLACGYNFMNTTMPEQQCLIAYGGLSDIVQVACGWFYIFALAIDGTLMSCGNNGCGQLGLGDTDDRREFTIVTSYVINGQEVAMPKNIVQIACGNCRMFILLDNGVLMSCGDNVHGQLGHGDTRVRSMFEVISGLPSDIVQIACGGEHVVALRRNGTLMGCGNNNNRFGQLGMIGHYDKFEELPVTDIVQVACGGNYTFVIRSDGSVMSCGDNFYGQLGRTGGYRFKKLDLPNDIIKITCGYSHVALLRSNGRVMVCGYNANGELGLGHNHNVAEFTEILPKDVADVWCGYNHTVIVRRCGMLMSTGLNSFGQLGLGDDSNRYSFTEIIKRTIG